MAFKPPWRERAEKKRRRKEEQRRARQMEENSNRRHKQTLRWAKASVAIALLSYMPALPLTFSNDVLGTGMVALGQVGLKDYVEAPSQVRLTHGAIRLAAAGRHFAPPIVYEAMRSSIGNDETNVTAADLQRVEFAVE